MGDGEIKQEVNRFARANSRPRVEVNVVVCILCIIYNSHGVTISTLRRPRYV